MEIVIIITMIIIISNNNDDNNDDIIYIYGLDYGDHYGFSRLTEQNSPCSLSKSNGDAAKL